jgi:hypothetical protein
MRPATIVLTALLALTACAEDAPRKPLPPNFTDAFPDVPIPPGGTVASWSGSVDALQLTFRSPTPVTGVAEAYRTEFAKPGWTVLSDMQTPDGNVALLAEKDKRAVWIRIERGDSGSRIMMTGVVPGRDSVYEATRRAVRDTTNTVVPRALPR